MKKNILIIVISFISINMVAQTAAPIAGQYYLEGVRETASGFKLNEDSSFEFFFSYGALDRTGKGSWKVNGDKIILNSIKPNAQCFELVNSKILDTDQVNIKILDPNTFFLSHVYAIMSSGNQKSDGMSNKDGLIIFPKQAVDSITLIFEFCPEKTAIFTINNKKENYFEFRFDQSIMDVFFENLVLTKDKDGLLGEHPLLKKGQYHFLKREAAH